MNANVAYNPLPFGFLSNVAGGQSGADFSQRFGDIAGPAFPDLESLTMKLIPVKSTKAETVKIPFLANYLGGEFTDKQSL